MATWLSLPIILSPSYPHDVDVGALCRAYHVETRQLEVDHLAAALDEPFDGMRVLEVKADRSSLRALHASIKAAL